ncbi:hypothetical protein VSK91_08115 [Bacillus swezeyi]|uniref:hypothetical protein n=1 Tax=Bacillus swezeyi TaxID=1925020 RepID=UPI0039C5E4DF
MKSVAPKETTSNSFLKRPSFSTCLSRSAILQACLLLFQQRLNRGFFQPKHAAILIQEMANLLKV